MKTLKLFTLLAALLCATTAWAQTTYVGTDTELRNAIQDGANITVTADIDLSNSTLVISANTTVTIDLGGHILDRGLTQRDYDNGGQVFTVRNGEIVVNGEGILQVIDMMGRQLFSKESSSDLILPTSYLTPGIYVLRLINGENV